MTTEVATTKSALEQFREEMGGEAIPGLEDVRQSDLTVPVIQIGHGESAGKFIDKLTGEQLDSLDVVLLGILKSRIMWPPQQSAPGQKPQPLCRSRNAQVGKPGDNFPWADFKKGADKNPDLSPESLGSEEIACATCYFQEWGSDPKNDSPRCTLQYTFPVVDPERPDALRGLLTMQRTAIKPANAYITGFVRDGAPIFTHVTNLTLDVNHNGSVTYSVPKFKRGEASPADVALWRNWSGMFAEIKNTVQGRDLGDSVTVSTSTGEGDGVENGKAF